MKNLLLILVILISIACQPDDPEYGFAVQNFSSDQNKIIESCIHQWDPDLNILERSTNLIIAETPTVDPGIGYVAHGYTYINYNNNQVKIQISPTLSNQDLCTITKHEIGHFIAYYNGKEYWQNHIEDNNTMGPYLEVMSTQITNDDLNFAF